ncbi:MAG: dihydropteroate synthase [Candidatus Omnitrophica bacterium]|nr:dihydropteroate synthase [Candidatus Omnitrophota bacterium]
MLLIGENINIMNKILKSAMKEKIKQPIQEIAMESQKNGVDYLDINIGPARKDGAQLMEWLIKTIREVSNLPLSIDTTNIEAIKAGLKIEGENTIINSIQATEEKMDSLLPLMKEYKCKCIALLIGKEGMPRDVNERGALAAAFSAKTDEMEIPHQNVLFDPIVLPVPYQQDQVVATLEFMQMFKDMFPDFSSTCGLSNVSNGAPEKLRPLINRTYLTMLSKYSMEGAILDGLDKEIIEMSKGKKEAIKNLIWKAMEEDIKIDDLSEEERNYVKTVNVLKGKSLYSHSWLKI